MLGYLRVHRLRLILVVFAAVISTGFMVLAPFLVGKVTTTLFASIADGVFYWETVHRLRLILVVFAAVISTGFMVLAPFLVGKVTTTLFASIADGVFYWETIVWLLAALVALYLISQLFTFLQGFVMAKITTTTLFASIADGVFYWETIVWLLAALVALYLISQLFTFLQGFVMAKITANVMQTLRREIDEKMHRLNLAYYDGHTHGDILSVITNDVDTINNTISQNLTSVVTQVTTAVGVLIMMFAISPKLSIIPIVMVPLSLLSAAGVMKASEKYYAQQQDLLGKVNGYVEEMYNGQSVVQAFNYQRSGGDEGQRKILRPAAGSAGKGQRLCGGDVQRSVRGAGVQLSAPGGAGLCQAEQGADDQLPQG